MDPSRGLRDTHKKEGSVTCRLDYRTGKPACGTEVPAAPPNPSATLGCSTQPPGELPVGRQSALSLHHGQALLRPGLSNGPSCPWPAWRRQVTGWENTHFVSQMTLAQLPCGSWCLPTDPWPRTCVHGATCGSRQSWACRSHSRAWAVQPWVPYINDLFQLPGFIYEQTPGLTGERRNFPSLCSSFHLFLLALEQGIAGPEQWEASLFVENAPKLGMR